MVVIGTFDLGGHKWAVKFSPYGYKNEYNSMTLQVSLLSATATILAVEVEYWLLNHKTGTFSTVDVNRTKSNGTVSTLGDGLWRYFFMRKDTFEKSDYLKDDNFTVKCSVRLLKPMYVDSLKKVVVVPSSDFLQQFNQLWKSGEGTDVAFQVGEETFSAHRAVLAARSPVFKAEFFGQMQESKAECVRIIDIKPKVFELLLHFVYTDTLCPNEELSFEMTQHLLVAADRYDLLRLKLICEKKLSDCIDVEKALDILMLADQSNCGQLKEICLDFVASDENLQAVMATDSFKYLMKNCPLILGNVLEKVDMKRKTN